MNCGPNNESVHIIQTADARDPISAYNMAVELARIRIWSEIIFPYINDLECPIKECPNKYFDRDSVSYIVERLGGGPSPNFANYYQIKIKYTCKFIVYCLRSNPVPPITEAPIGGGTNTGGTNTGGTNTGGTNTGGTNTGGTNSGGSNTGACIISFNKRDVSTSAGFGQITWTFAITITASSSNSSHTWAVGSCKITELNYSARGAPNSWSVANFLGTTKNLLSPPFNAPTAIVVTNGAGVATITGPLTPGLGGIFGWPGSVVQIKGEATDSNGDTEHFEFFADSP